MYIRAVELSTTCMHGFGVLSQIPAGIGQESFVPLCTSSLFYPIFSTSQHMIEPIR